MKKVAMRSGLALLLCVIAGGAVCVITSGGTLGAFCRAMDVTTEYVIVLHHSHEETHAIHPATAAKELRELSHNITEHANALTILGERELAASAARVVEALENLRRAEIRGRGFEEAAEDYSVSLEAIPIEICLSVSVGVR